MLVQILGLTGERAQLVLALASASPAGAAHGTFTKALASGSKGDEVSMLQKYLVSQNFLVIPKGIAMGTYGPATRLAVQKFQEKYGIAKKGSVGYGNVGPNTRLKLNALMAGM